MASTTKSVEQPRFARRAKRAWASRATTTRFAVVRPPVDQFLDLVVDFDATADFAIVSDSLRLQLTPPAATGFHIDVINDPHHVPVTAPAALLSQLDASIFANFATLPGPPLPTVAHLGLHDLDAARSGDACYFFGTLT